GAAFLHTAVNYWQFHEGLNTLLVNGFKKDEIIELLNQGMFDSRWQGVLSSGGFSGFGASYLSVVVGASGAIYGLLVAFAFMFPNAGLSLIFLPIPVKAKYFVPRILLLDLILGFKGS